MVRGAGARRPRRLGLFEHLFRFFPIADPVEGRLVRKGVLESGGVREYVADLDAKNQPTLFYCGARRVLRLFRCRRKDVIPDGVAVCNPGEVWEDRVPKIFSTARILHISMSHQNCLNLAYLNAVRAYTP